MRVLEVLFIEGPAEGGFLDVRRSMGMIPCIMGGFVAFCIALVWLYMGQKRTS